MNISSHDRLLVLRKRSLCALDLSKKITLENLVLLEPNEDRYRKLIKINDKACLLINEEKYKVVKL